MMNKVFQFTLDNGSTVLIESQEEVQKEGVERAGVGSSIALKSNQTFEEAVSIIGPTSQSILNTLQSSNIFPQEVQIEFGIKFDVKAGAIIASASTAANFKVNLKWNHNNDD